MGIQSYLRDPAGFRIGLYIFLGTVTSVVALHATSVLERLDAAALDATQRIVRSIAIQPAVENIAIVGIDEKTEALFSEPFALWHKHLGEALLTIARGKPKLIVLDVVLPERPYDHLIQGLNAQLVRGISAAKANGRLLVGVRLDSRGIPQKIDNLLLASVGPQSLGLAYASVDEDRTARRLQSPHTQGASRFPLLVERVNEALALAPPAGIIDFACGKMLTYVPLQDLVATANAQSSSLESLFADRIVFIGKVGPDEDPVRQPLSVASWLPAATAPPGVVLLAQTVRASESGRILPELSGPALYALVALAGLTAFLTGIWRAWLATVLGIAIVAAAVFCLYLAGVFLPPTAQLATLLLGATTRSAYEAIEQRRLRLSLERQFGGYVSANLLDAILRGEVDPSRPRKYQGLGFLFADLRGFTTMTEQFPAEHVLSLLNRYYAAITPAIHHFEGTIDNFRGDGILVIFGAPRAVDDGAMRAVLAARDLFARLADLNVRLEAEGLAPLSMVIGLSCGDAVAGNIGTRAAHAYSAVGDAVNIAARLQSLCTPLGMKMIVTADIARVSEGRLPLVPLGSLELKGHAPVEAFGVPVSREIGETAPRGKAVSAEATVQGRLAGHH